MMMSIMNENETVIIIVIFIKTKKPNEKYVDILEEIMILTFTLLPVYSDI